MSKSASTPAKLVEDIPLPKPKDSAVAREEKQLPPLPGQRSVTLKTWLGIRNGNRSDIFLPSILPLAKGWI